MLLSIFATRGHWIIYRSHHDKAIVVAKWMGAWWCHYTCEEYVQHNIYLRCDMGIVMTSHTRMAWRKPLPQPHIINRARHLKQLPFAMFSSWNNTTLCTPDKALLEVKHVGLRICYFHFLFLHFLHGHHFTGVSGLTCRRSKGNTWLLIEEVFL